MKSPQELRNAAWNIGWPIALTAGGILLGAFGMSLCHCDVFTPNIDPAPYPCHDPRMHYCPDGRSCCFSWAVCEGGEGTNDPHGKPRCEDIGNTWDAVHERDAGADH